MSKAKVLSVLEQSKKLAPQKPLNVRRGMQIRRTAGGIPVIRHHYSADPSRDPEIHPEWREKERKTYTSQAAWDREQEIIDEAGGGELVFADTLLTHWNKIVITDPAWRPDPRWRVEAASITEKPTQRHWSDAMWTTQEPSISAANTTCREKKSGNTLR